MRGFEALIRCHAKRAAPCGRFSLRFCYAGSYVQHLASKASACFGGAREAPPMADTATRASGSGLWATQPLRRQDAHRAPQQVAKPKMPQVRILSSGPEKPTCFDKSVFQLNPPFRVGEILLRNVKYSLRSCEIAAAVGGFNFTFCFSKIFHQRRKPLISP